MQWRLGRSAGRWSGSRVSHWQNPSPPLALPSPLTPVPSVNPLTASACLPLPCRCLPAGGAGASGGAAALPRGGPQARRHGQFTICRGAAAGNCPGLAGQDAVGGWQALGWDGLGWAQPSTPVSTRPMPECTLPHLTPPTHPLPPCPPLLQVPCGDSGGAGPGEGQPGCPGALWVSLPRSALCAPGLRQVPATHRCPALPCSAVLCRALPCCARWVMRWRAVYGRLVQRQKIP